MNSPGFEYFFEVLVFSAYFFPAVIAGVFGSVVGLGGGFVMGPILRIAFADVPLFATAASLFLDFGSSSAASVGYVRDKRVDFRLAIMLTAGALPGSILGALLLHRIALPPFSGTAAVILIVAGIAILRPSDTPSRLLGEKTFMHQPAVAIAAGLLVGVASNLFGVGSGLFVIALLLIGARMPAHVATATSSFVIMLTAPIGIIARVLAGDIELILAVAVASGGLVGGAFGPSIAKRISPPQLINIVALAFVVAAIGVIGRPASMPISYLVRH